MRDNQFTLVWEKFSRRSASSVCLSGPEQSSYIVRFWITNTDRESLCWFLQILWVQPCSEVFAWYSRIQVFASMVTCSPFTWPLELYHIVIILVFQGSGVATPLRQLTKNSEWISRHMNTVGDKSLQNRAPMSSLFKMNGVLPSLFIWKDVKITHLWWSLLIFKAAPQN